MLTVIVLVIVFWAFVADAHAQDCVRRWNPVLRQWDTHCADGSSATDRYNDVLKQWERSITPAPPAWPRYDAPTPPAPQRCVTRYNRVLRQYETHCE